MLENRQLHFFVVAAEHLNITKAAQALYITQPALSRNIHQIEEELGVELFHRAHKRIALTEAGKCFLVEARRALQQLDLSVTATQKAARGELGRLAIGYTSTAGLVSVPKLVSAFHKRYPGPMIKLQELDPPELENALHQGAIDVALLYGVCAGEEYETRPMLSDHFILAMPEHHWLAKRGRVHLLDLAEENFIMPSRTSGGWTAAEMLDECRLAGFLPQTAQEIATATVQTTLGLVSAGLGVSMIPAALRMFSRKGVVFRPLSKNRVQLQLNMQWRRKSASVVLRNFLKIAG